MSTIAGRAPFRVPRLRPTFKPRLQHTHLPLPIPKNPMPILYRFKHDMMIDNSNITYWPLRLEQLRKERAKKYHLKRFQAKFGLAARREEEKEEEPGADEDPLTRAKGHKRKAASGVPLQIKRYWAAMKKKRAEKLEQSRFTTEYMRAFENPPTA